MFWQHFFLLVADANSVKYVEFTFKLAKETGVHYGLHIQGLGGTDRCVCLVMFLYLGGDYKTGIPESFDFV